MQQTYTLAVILGEGTQEHVTPLGSGLMTLREARIRRVKLKRRNRDANIVVINAATYLDNDA